jgi:hypothetical protein
MHGTAWRTSGGLEKKDLKYNKQGSIVSRALSNKAASAYKANKGGIRTILKKNRARKFSRHNQP